MRVRTGLRTELADAGPDPLGQGLDRQHGIRQRGGDVARGEFAGARLLGLLREGDAAHLLHGLEAEGSVGSGSGEDDRDGAPVHLAHQRDEEAVDRPALAEALLGGTKLEVVALDADDDVGLRQVDPARHQRHGPLDDAHLVAGRRQGMAERGRVERFPVLQHDDDGRVGPGRKRLQQMHERARVRGRGAQGDDDRPAVPGAGLLGGLHHHRLQPQRTRARAPAQPLGRCGGRWPVRNRSRRRAASHRAVPALGNGAGSDERTRYSSCSPPGSMSPSAGSGEGRV
ncbi:hypothetical protein CHKEEEPN_0957 [Methylorubrum podarium]|nr:hypothetical protein CHKEEEPN_0957 [Methylorubrum podarium]